MITDGYATWYADRLWNLLPPVYRSLDQGASPGEPGPLRELVNRIGTQAAVVRRGIDRLGENQFIETCDSWAIPYIGDLVATRLVACLDTAAQRIDVAKTIYYRRRAGTVGLLEELAADIAGRDARVVEFFRRMARTRHQFDPPLSYRIENPLTGPVGFTGNTVEIAEGLIGAYSSTPAGGFADLRKTYPASNTGSAFDEYFYTADLRAGGQTLGHFNIRNLGVFLWWLRAFPISAATPVSNNAAAPCLTFDPTGREMPLFAASQRVAERAAWGEHWISPDEWELPVPIRQTLWDTVPDRLYASDFSAQAFSVGMLAGGTGASLPANSLTIHPHRGVFSFVDPATGGPGAAPVGTLAVCYNFGLLGEVGAGGFDTGILTDLSLPATTATITGGFLTDLNPVIGAVGGDRTILFADSLTYIGPTQKLTVPTGAKVALAARNEQRPVLRWTGAKPQKWEIHGEAAQGSHTPTQLVIEGLLLQGADILLTGNFDSVVLRMVTVDPGSVYVTPAGAVPPSPLPFYATAIDGMPLRSATIYVQGAITNLVLERCITGPIRVRNGGAVTLLQASDSILQSIPSHLVAKTGKFTNPTLFDPVTLADAFKFETSHQAKAIVAGSPTLADLIGKYSPSKGASAALISAMLSAIGGLTQAEAEALWPLALADLALGFNQGRVELSQCTVMGRIQAHILSASESILDGVATAEDAQEGCVRFSSYAKGSTLHQPYRSVVTSPHPSIFVSRDYGQPGYAQLRSDADNQILASAQVGKGSGCAADSVAETLSILTGAENGAEMGVYSSEAVALKRRGLALKYEEYAPIGQLPVWVDAD